DAAAGQVGEIDLGDGLPHGAGYDALLFVKALAAAMGGDAAKDAAAASGDEHHEQEDATDWAGMRHDQSPGDAGEGCIGMERSINRIYASGRRPATMGDRQNGNALLCRITIETDEQDKAGVFAYTFEVMYRLILGVPPQAMGVGGDQLQFVQHLFAKPWVHIAEIE